MNRERPTRVGGVLLVLACALSSCSSSDDDRAVDTVTANTLASDTTAVSPSTTSTWDGGELATPPAAGNSPVTRLTLAQRSSEPFDRVAIDGVEVTVVPDESGSPTLTTEPDLTGVELEMYVPGATEPIPMQLLIDESGVSTVVAMNPLDPFADAAAHVQFVDGDDRGPAIDLELTGLERSPGAWQQAVDAIVTSIGDHAATLGSSRAELAAAPLGSLGPDLSALQLALGMFDDGTDADVESLADEFDEPAMEMLDALIGRIDLTAALPRSINSEPHGFARPRAQPEPVSMHGFRAAAFRAAPTGLECTDFELDIPDGDALAAAMQRGITARAAANATITEDVAAASAAVGAFNDAASVSGNAATAGVVGAAALATGALDALYSGLSVWRAADGGRYPTRFNSITAEPSTTEFNEDFIEGGSVAVTVVASATGFDASSWAAVAASATNAAVNVYSATTGKTVAGALDLTGAVGDVLNLGLDKIRESATGQAFAKDASLFTSWCPNTWTVPLTNPDQVALKSALGVLDADDPGFGYRPQRVGNDFLTVSTRGFFGLSISTQIPVDVHRLQVIATPSRIEVNRPGETVQVTAAAEYADTPSLAWDPGQGTWDDGAQPETDGETTRPLLTPTDPSAYPFEVTVRSTSETGLRESKSNSEPREDTVEVVLAPFVVLPDPGSVHVNQTLAFTATDHDGTPVEVTWTATGGGIPAGPSSAAVYSAGDEPGMYEVTARRGNDSVTANVRVVEASCLVGTWQLNPDRFAELLRQSGTDITPTGGAWLLTVSDDLVFTSTLDGFAFAFNEGGFTTTVEINGSQTGTITATDTQITHVETTSFSVGVTLQTPVGPISVAPGDSPVGAEFVGGAYQCEDGVLYVENTGYQMLWDPVS